MDREALIARLKDDDDFPTADELLDYGKNHTTPSYRARYNLACYYSELAGRESPGSPDEASASLDEALRNLRIALDESPGTGLDRWAVTDPSLKALRKDPKNGPGFYKLVWATTNPSPLSEVESIGKETARRLAAAEITSAGDLVAAVTDAEKREALAKRLAAAEITSAGDLVAAVTDAEKREALAKRLEAKEADLVTWSRVAELMKRIHALPQEINLLGDLGIRSVQDLVARPVSTLARDLAQANAVVERTEKTPDEACVRGWRLLASTP